MATKKMKFEIQSHWDGRPATQPPIRLSLSKSSEGQGISLEVTAPFHDDPPPPAPSGGPQLGLWDYEVVEAFFLGEDEKYLEVELSPHGQHLVLLLHGVRNIIKEALPLEVMTSIQADRSSWRGSATIPLDYLPVGLKGFNAYGIHGVGSEREYLSLYPADAVKHSHPDFHRLEYFKDVDWSGVVDVSKLPTVSSVWS